MTKAHPLTLIEVAFGDVPSSYGANLLPAITANLVQYVIHNDTNQPIYISVNGGASNNFRIGEGLSINAGAQDVADIRVKYQTEAPTAGTVYITPLVE